MQKAAMVTTEMAIKEPTTTIRMIVPVWSLMVASVRSKTLFSSANK